MTGPRSSLMAHKSPGLLSGEEDVGTQTCESEVRLSNFLGAALWWPQEAVSPNAEDATAQEAETCAKCPARPAPRKGLKNLRTLLAGASFETVDAHSQDKCPTRDYKDMPEHSESGEARATQYSKLNMGRSPLEPVPPCFALFTRFNCNVTLVAQRLFASKVAATVLCSGSVVVEGDEIVRVLKHTKAGERVYKRHVMLNVTNGCSKHLPLLQEPFSYGFLVTRLQALPPKARDLVLSESMPFGGILDHCGISRTVDTDRQLHIHIGEELFSANTVHTQDEGSSYCTASLHNGCQYEDNAENRQQDAGACQCKMVPKGTRCTFGRLTTIRCDGKPAARVVEILNDRLVLAALLEAEEVQRQGPGGTTAPISYPADGSTSTTQQRAAFLAGRCRLSVARCPVHRAHLPRPHVTQRELRLSRKPDEGCRLCGSTTCSTDFQAAYTEDLP